MHQIAGHEIGPDGELYELWEPLEWRRLVSEVLPVLLMGVLAAVVAFKVDLPRVGQEYCADSLDTLGGCDVVPAWDPWAAAVVVFAFAVFLAALRARDLVRHPWARI